MTPEQLRMTVMQEAHRNPAADITVATQEAGPRVLTNLPVFSGGPSAAYRRSVQEADRAGQDLSAIIAQAQAGSDAAAREARDAILNRGKAAADQELATQQRAAQLAKVNADVTALFGADVLNPESLSAALVQDIRRTEETHRAKLADFQARAGTTLLDDPLAFIINAIELPQVAADLNTEAARLNTLKEQLTTVQAQAKDYADLNMRSIPAITAEQAAAAAQQKLETARLDAANADVAAINQRVSLAQVSMQRAVTKVNIEAGLSGQELQAAMARHQSLVENIKFADSALTRQAAAEKAYEALQDIRLKKIAVRNAASALGWSPESFPTSMFDRMPANMQMRFISGGIAGDFGANPYDAWQTLEQFAGPNLSPTLKAWQREVGAIVSSIRADTKFQQYSGEKQAEEMRKQVALRLSQKMAEPVTGSNTFLKELSPATMQQALPNMEKSVAGTLLKPLIESGGSPTTQIVVDSIATGLAEKNVPVTGQAYAIAQYYKANVTERNRQSNADAMRVNMPQDYRVTLELPLAKGGTRTYDLTNPAEVQLYLLRKSGIGMFGLVGNVGQEVSDTFTGNIPAPGFPKVQITPPSEATKAYWGARNSQP